MRNPPPKLITRVIIASLDNGFTRRICEVLIPHEIGTVVADNWDDFIAQTTTGSFSALITEPAGLGDAGDWIDLAKLCHLPTVLVSSGDANSHADEMLTRQFRDTVSFCPNVDVVRRALPELLRRPVRDRGCRTCVPAS